MGIEALLTSQVIGLDAALTGKLNTSGGTLTGALNGTSANFSGEIKSEYIPGSFRIGRFSGPSGTYIQLDEYGQFSFNNGTKNKFGMNASSLHVPNDGALGFSSGNVMGSIDTVLYRDAAGTLAQRNSTNAQTFRLYNTYTSATSFENLQLQWSSNEARIGTSVGSAGGTFREMKFGYWNSAGTFSTGITVRTDGLHVGGTGGPQLTNAESNLFIGGGTNTDKVMILTGGRTINAGTGAFNESFISLAGRTHPTVASNVTVALKNSGVFRVLDSSDVSRFECTATGAATFSGQLTNALGTIAASTPATFTQTWNNVATTFTGILSNVTDTASDASSLLLDLQVGGSSIFNVRRAYIGGSKYDRAVVSIPQYSYFSSRLTGGFIGFGVDESTVNFAIDIGSTSGVRLISGGYLAWNNSTSNVPAGTNDLFLYRDAARTLALRDGVNANVLNIYNTYTSSTSYERGKIAWESNVLKIGTEKGSAGGSARALELQTDGTTRLTVASDGGLTVAAWGGAARNGISWTGDSFIMTVGSNNTALYVGSNGVRTSLGIYENNTDTAASSCTFRTRQVSGARAGNPTYVAGGNAGSSGDYNGGALYLNGGTKVGTGSDGNIIIGSSAGNLEITDARNVILGTTTGTKIGTATTQKIGFYDKTPVVQPTAVADATDAASVITQLNALLSRMRDLGLIAT